MLALLYDVHGNLRALDAVLADADAAGASRFVLGGDYGAFGADPEACLDRLRGLPDATWIRGNWERWCADPAQAVDDPVVRGALEAAVAALGDEEVARLGGLPGQAAVGGVRYAHGSPKSDVESFSVQPGDDDEELLAGATERRVVFGHTHLQFSRSLPSGTELVNPGSVGFPLDGDRRAAYALVGDDGAIELRRVDYDADGAVAALRARYAGEQWAADTAERLARASF